MSDFCITLDEKRCIHCKACERHCKAWNELPGGITLGVHRSVGPLPGLEPPVLRALFMTCLHCEEPRCIRTCPTGAMRRREDGIVYLDTRHCVGCRACIMACPWRVPQWNAAYGTVLKCDFCRERIDAGQQPACVTACTARALSFTDTSAARAALRALQSLAENSFPSAADDGNGRME